MLSREIFGENDALNCTDSVELFPPHSFNSNEGEVAQPITIKTFLFLLQKLDR